MTIILIMFIDASRNLYKYNQEKERDQAADNHNPKPFDFMKLFVAQRNFYLTLSNLIFLLVIWRVRHLLKEVFV